MLFLSHQHLRKGGSDGSRPLTYVTAASYDTIALSTSNSQ